MRVTPPGQSCQLQALYVWSQLLLQQLPFDEQPSVGALHAAACVALAQNPTFGGR
jgi:hypothetical protein